jgi:hypothetical protein
MGSLAQHDLLGGSTFGHQKSTLRFGLRQKANQKSFFPLTHVILIVITSRTI